MFWILSFGWECNGAVKHYWISFLTEINYNYQEKMTKSIEIRSRK